jgi:hypothetical protein
MTQPRRHFRHGLCAVLSISALCFACSSDQKSPNTPEDVPPAEAPQDASPPPAGDAPLPNGEPTNTPPAEPPPQGSNDHAPTNLNAPANMIGAPKDFAALSGKPLDARYP